MKTRSGKASVAAFAAAWLVAAPASGEATKHALVIGVDKYVTDANATLRYAVKDAQAVSTALRNAGFVEVVELTEDGEATRQRVVEELTSFRRTLEREDTFVLYFAGHGVSQEVRQGLTQVYWLMRSANLLNLEVEGIRLGHIIEYLGEIPAGRKLLILDHCYSGQISSVLGAGDASREPTATPTLEPRDLGQAKEMNRNLFESRKSGLVVLGSATDRAYEHPQLEHGLFTKLLLDAMQSDRADQNGNGQLEVAELGQRLEEWMDEQDDRFNVVQVPLTWREAGPLSQDWPLLQIPTSLPQRLRLRVAKLINEGGLPQEYGNRSDQAIDALKLSLETNTPLIGVDKEIVGMLKSFVEAGTTGMSPNLQAALLQEKMDSLGAVQ